ncbi:hypothetical protein VTI74DRAFT_8628 [Chaetomium olivicolor]
MDFGTLFRGALPPHGSNISRDANGSAEDGLPDNILETLSPLLGFQFNPLMRLLMILYNVVGSYIGIDPTYILTSVAVVWAANKLWYQLSSTINSLARQHFMSSIDISSSDDIFLHMMKWLASQPNLFNSRSLTAETASKGAWEDEDESELKITRVSPDGSNVYLNFSNQEAKVPPQFTPAMGKHGFWFRGRYFTLQRKQESLFDPTAGAHGMPQFKDKECLVLSCFGRSPEPIKQLLQHAKEQYYHSHQAKTIVRRPANQSMRRYGHWHSWQQVANRPVRPMTTVVLDDEQKVRVLSDIQEFLLPGTARFYANRGIPLRRGYLFHGPPGTGKTSLSFALAGVFGLDIYVISLLDPTLTEEDLLALFVSLPRRCIVLLEDIDTAGLKRAEDPATDSSSSSSSSSSDDEDNKRNDSNNKDKDKKSKKSRHKSKNDWKVSDLARELKRHGNNDSSEKKGISLSGLLNAIDGVASHEGRVLIMTTNKPEALDEALIRPGRVDLQVAFTNATQEQARELFVRMYEPDSRKVAATLDKFLPPSSPLLPPLTPFSEPPPTPSSTISSKDGNMTDISGATEVDDSVPAPATSPMASKRGAPAPLQLPGRIASPFTTATIQPDSTAALASSTNALPREDDILLQENHMHPSELAYVAAQFASKIPPGQFSPAELQGFLLKRKKTPRRALAEVEVWVQGMLERRAVGAKVLDVQ